MIEYKCEYCGDNHAPLSGGTCKQCGATVKPVFGLIDGRLITSIDEHKALLSDCRYSTIFGILL